MLGKELKSAAMSTALRCRQQCKGRNLSFSHSVFSASCTQTGIMEWGGQRDVFQESNPFAVGLHNNHRADHGHCGLGAFLRGFCCNKSKIPFFSTITH